MQNKDIEIFLELVNSRNITKASEHLFISQSVISTRLKRLEEELGYELFTRSKGMREIELTHQGSEFVSVALRWRNLYEEAELIRDETRYVLRIASPESVYFDFLEPLLVRILRNHTAVRISSSISDSAGVYEMMENGVIDFGFASYASSHYDILHQPVYSQGFCLVYDGECFGGSSAESREQDRETDRELDRESDGEPNEYPDGGNNREKSGKNSGENNGETAGPKLSARTVSPADLDLEKEIRLTGGNFSNISLWRERWFKGKDKSRVEVNSPHMIAKCLKEFGSWALLPKATAGMLAKLYGVQTCELTDAPDSRQIYLLRHTGAPQGSADALKIFESELEIYLAGRNASR